MIGTSCEGADTCGQAVELIACQGPADPGWWYIDGGWWCPACIWQRWTPRTDLSTDPIVQDLVASFDAAWEHAVLFGPETGVRATLPADAPVIPPMPGLADVLRDAAAARCAPGGTPADGERVLAAWLAEQGLPAR